MSKDLNRLIGDWQLDLVEDSNNFRKIKGDDNKPKIQVRVKCGLLQWEMTGRPDGKRPYGHESLLQHCQALIRKHKRKYGSDKDFKITQPLLSEIQEEVMDYYHRRVALFHLGEYQRACDDAIHNLNLMKIIRKYVDDQEIVMSHEQYRAFVTMDKTRAQAMVDVQKHKFTEAIEHINVGIQEIKEFYGEYDREDLIPQSQEIGVLENLKKHLREKYRIPLTKQEKLESLKEIQKKAVENEDYEKAAQLRDEIDELMKG